MPCGCDHSSILVSNQGALLLYPDLTAISSPVELTLRSVLLCIEHQDAAFTQISSAKPECSCVLLQKAAHFLSFFVTNSVYNMLASTYIFCAPMHVYDGRD